MAQFTYLSPEWALEATRRLQQDLTPEKMKHISSSMVTVYSNCPDGVDRSVYYEVVDGVVDAISTEKDTLAQAATASIRKSDRRAEPDIWAFAQKAGLRYTLLVTGATGIATN